MRWALPSLRSGRSTPSGASKGRPSGLGYSPRCRTALVACGEGRPAIRPSSPYGPPNARQRKSILSICSCCANWHTLGIYLATVNRQLVRLFFNRCLWVPPHRCLVLQLHQQGVHPGGGNGGPQGRSEGDTSPDKYSLLLNIFSKRPRDSARVCPAG